jgi:Cdc6-like AAA superfamily ATPase
MATNWQELSYRVSLVFTPSSPVDEKQLFSGRTDQLNQIIDVINQKGQHAIIFGERGVGKTSLANVLTKILDEVIPGTENLILAKRKNCDATDDFTTIWKKLLYDVKVPFYEQKIGFKNNEVLSDYSIANAIDNPSTPENICRLLEILSDRRPIFIIDEFDRITDQKTKTTIADTIKMLSDHTIRTTVIIVGVADSVDQLIREHQSIERALVQVKMPRMSNSELEGIVETGLKVLEMSIDKDALAYISVLSQGLPHYTHLLALHSTRKAIDNHSKKVSIQNVQEAIVKALDQAQATTTTAYHKAVSSPRRDNIFRQVLLACALAKPDGLGYFAASDVREPLNLIMSKEYDIPGFSRHLNDFCDEDRGPILQKIGRERKFRFRFINPLMQPYITMQGFKDNYIKQEHLSVLRNMASFRS